MCFDLLTWRADNHVSALSLVVKLSGGPDVGALILTTYTPIIIVKVVDIMQLHCK